MINHPLAILILVSVKQHGCPLHGNYRCCNPDERSGNVVYHEIRFLLVFERGLMHPKKTFSMVFLGDWRSLGGGERQLRIRSVTRHQALVFPCCCWELDYGEDLGGCTGLFLRWPGPCLGLTSCRLPRVVPNWRWLLWVYCALDSHPQQHQTVKLIGQVATTRPMERSLRFQSAYHWRCVA